MWIFRALYEALTGKDREEMERMEKAHAVSLEAESSGEDITPEELKETQE